MTTPIQNSNAATGAVTPESLFRAKAASLGNPLLNDLLRREKHIHDEIALRARLVELVNGFKTLALVQQPAVWRVPKPGGGTMTQLPARGDDILPPSGYASPKRLLEEAEAYGQLLDIVEKKFFK